MKLEHKKEQVLPLGKFLIRLGRYTFFVIILLGISLGIGIVGYMHYGHLSLLDGFYMASMILTGMGPTVEMTDDGAKIFSSLYALYSGVAFLSSTAVFFTPIVHRLMHVLHVDDVENNAH